MSLESGYSVTIKGWVPADPNDLDRHGKAIEALKKAKAGDFADVLAIMAVEETDIAARTRRAKAAPEAEKPAAVAGPSVQTANSGLL